MDHVGLMPYRHGKTTASEDMQHREIARKNIGLESVQAVRPSNGNDVPHQ
jgi:hypothetical protein